METPKNVTISLRIEEGFDCPVLTDEHGTVIGAVVNGSLKFSHVGKELLIEQARINVEKVCRRYSPSG